MLKFSLEIPMVYRGEKSFKFHSYSWGHWTGKGLFEALFLCLSFWISTDVSFYMIYIMMIIEYLIRYIGQSMRTLAKFWKWNVLLYWERSSIDLYLLSLYLFHQVCFSHILCENECLILNVHTCWLTYDEQCGIVIQSMMRQCGI